MDTITVQEGDTYLANFKGVREFAKGDKVKASFSCKAMQITKNNIDDFTSFIYPYFSKSYQYTKRDYGKRPGELIYRFDLIKEKFFLVEFSYDKHEFYIESDQWFVIIDDMNYIILHDEDFKTMFKIQDPELKEEK